MTPLARVLEAQRLLRSAIHLLEQARDAAPTHPLATSLAVAAHDAASTERGLDLVVFALRDVADPTRGVR
jgi:hypothetical protein